MHFSNIAIAISIAILYPMFFKKLGDVATNIKELNKKCGYRYGYFETENEKIDKKDCDKKYESVDTKRFTMLLVAGLVALVVSYFIESPAVSIGLGGAGIISILYSTFDYWSYLDDKSKLILVGLALGTLLFSPKFISKYSNKIMQ